MSDESGEIQFDRPTELGEDRVPANAAARHRVRSSWEGVGGRGRRRFLGEESGEDPLDGPSTSPEGGARDVDHEGSDPSLTPSRLRQQLADASAGSPLSDDWYVPPSVVTEEMLARRARIRSVLEFYYQRPLNTREDSPWSMMHHMLGWSVDGYIEIGGPGGRHASVIGWLAGNGVCEGQRLLTVRNGRLTALTADGLQGHEGQFLALLAQARVSADQPLQVQGQKFTIRDLMLTEQLSCRSKTELTFKLMGLIHYLPTDTTWKNDRGESWDFPRMMREEIQAPINGVTCGGTHRLMALHYAVRRRSQEGYPIDGIWQQAQEHVARYQQRAFQLQNRDGSFSSDFFRQPGNWGDIDRKLKTSGHTLELMVYSLPHPELQHPQLKRGVDYVCNLMIHNRYYRWGRGPQGHAIRALSLYEERVFGTRPGERNYPQVSSRTPVRSAVPSPGRLVPRR